MMIRYWNPAQETATLSRQLDRLFNDFMGAEDTYKTTTWTPAIELVDRGDELVLTAYLPGITAEDVDIQVTKESVLITGQRQHSTLEEGERALYSNVRYGQFRRLVELPYEVQNTDVKAAFDNGVVTLTLPKHEEEKNKVVKLSLGQSVETEQ